jgi:hypothetical protein
MSRLHETSLGLLAEAVLRSARPMVSVVAEVPSEAEAKLVVEQELPAVFAAQGHSVVVTAIDAVRQTRLDGRWVVEYRVSEVARPAAALIREG